MTLPSPALVSELEILLNRKRAFWNLEEAADECGRSTKTLRNLISKHALRVRRGWRVVRRQRYREYTLSARTVAVLMAMTRLRTDEFDPRPRS
jgi:hypothetical protein